MTIFLFDNIVVYYSIIIRVIDMSLQAHKACIVNRNTLYIHTYIHLCGVFRVLERYAFNLKSEHSFFKRSIKFDDVELSLALDFCTEERGEWQRITYSEASEKTRGRFPKVRSSTDGIDAPGTPMPGPSGNPDRS